MEHGGYIMRKFDIYALTDDTKMLEIYKDITGSEELGISPTSLNEYTEKIKEICNFETKSQAMGIAKELFYKETAKRYYKALDM